MKHSLSEEDISKVVRNTEGYSGADMANLVQEACQVSKALCVTLRITVASGRLMR